MILSIIIPTYNEAAIIEKTITYLQHNLVGKTYEIIVSDAGSTDNTIEIAEKLGIKILRSPLNGRWSNELRCRKCDWHRILFCACRLFANTKFL